LAKKFPGFPEGKFHLTPIPAQFFSELLPEIEELAELKLTLYIFWRLDRMEQAFRYLRYEEISRDELFMQGLGDTPAEAEAALSHALEQAVNRGTLLQSDTPARTSQSPLYFLNSPKGRAALEALLRGDWRPVEDDRIPVELAPAPANIFRLYEENIGPLTPMLAEALREAENEYPAIWLEDAVRIAVKNNKRNWNYIQAILRRWQREGRDERKDRGDSEEIRRRYTEWESSDEQGSDEESQD